MKDPRDYDREDEAESPYDHGRYEEEDEMDKNWGHYLKADRQAGKFLGLDFPYVPGDPGL